MKAQQPAKGILTINDWGHSIMFKAVCDCGQPDHSHTLDVDADEVGVNVTIYTTSKTKWWNVDRWKQMWVLMIKGYIEEETVLSMDKQAALNYVSALSQSIAAVEKFQKEKNVKNKNS
jgi:hypothetical protein